MAIAEASQVDECKDWADKAAALASYARQSQDEEMEKTAMRIRARAIRRCGELLKEIEKAHGANQNIKADNRPKVETRQQAAKGAGMSKHQAKEAIRVASVPAEKFEQQVESPKPPTITKLAEQGTKKPRLISQPGPRWSCAESQEFTLPDSISARQLSFIHALTNSPTSPRWFTAAACLSALSSSSVK